MSEYFGIVATPTGGSAAAMELIGGRDAAAARIVELVESDHTVILLACKPVDYDLTAKPALLINA